MNKIPVNIWLNFKFHHQNDQIWLQSKDKVNKFAEILKGTFVPSQNIGRCPYCPYTKLQCCPRHSFKFKIALNSAPRNRNTIPHTHTVWFSFFFFSFSFFNSLWRTNIWEVQKASHSTATTSVCTWLRRGWASTSALPTANETFKALCPHHIFCISQLSHLTTKE